MNVDKKIKLIQKIEGEAKLHIFYDQKKIDFVKIEFFSSRNIEKILQNKMALDALIINPRVCGICGHAHLQATLMALEDCYKGDLKVTKKAKILRDLTLNFEIIQNHFKWFYFTILPLLGIKNNTLKGAYASQIAAKAIAVLAGQYPHNSYAIVGGVVCEPTKADILKVRNFIYEIKRFFEENLVNDESDKILECDSVEKILNKDGDLPLALNILRAKSLAYVGKSYDRFIVFGKNAYFTRGKSIKTRVTKNIDEKFVKEVENQDSYAKNVLYKDKYYEVGPLSRAMLNKTLLIKDAHRRYGDSIFSRILARVCEIPRLLFFSKTLLEKINLDEPSFIEPAYDISNLSSTGIGVVEAARGSLIHKVKLQYGKIQDYTIITPTQWNLSSGTKEFPAIAQKAMMGLKDEKVAELVFKSFDVCSVCTTH